MLSKKKINKIKYINIYIISPIKIPASDWLKTQSASDHKIGHIEVDVVSKVTTRVVREITFQAVLVRLDS